MSVSLASLFPQDVKRLSSASGKLTFVPDLSRFEVPADLFERSGFAETIAHPLPVSLDASQDWITEYWDPHDASQKPMRCFSCSRVLAHRYTPFAIEVFERRHDVHLALGLLGIEPYRYCCKQMMLSYQSIPVQSVAKGQRVIMGETK